MFRFSVALLIVLTALGIGHSRPISSFVGHAFQAGDSRTDALALSKEAYDLILKDDYDAAIVKAELAIRKDPNLGEAYKNLALAYCDSGRVDQALEPAQKAVKLSPDFAKARYVLGKVFFRMELFDDAITQFREAIRLNPKYDKAYFLMGNAYDLLNKPDQALAALDQAIGLAPDFEYRRFRDYVAAYVQQKKQTALPAIVPVKGQTGDYALAVYSGIFYEALTHRDFDLIDRAADAARVSKEKVSGGYWKLQKLYVGLETPFTATSDYEWKQHLELLKEWVAAKPNSLTAKAALAQSYVQFAWRARGGGFANTVSQENWERFYERLDYAYAVLTTNIDRGQQVCPKWYSVMQQIALGQGWDRKTYENLFAQAVREPTWYDAYRQKAIYLLPQWHGKPGELEGYVNSFAQNGNGNDSALLYFMLNESAGMFDWNEKQKPAAHYDVLKKGFLELQKTYGANLRDTNWACYKAVLANDRLFARELFTQLKDNADLKIWDKKEFFDAAKQFASIQ
jgi:tetratricopeptide (TPR) repeat protein